MERERTGGVRLEVSVMIIIRLHSSNIMSMTVTLTMLALLAGWAGHGDRDSALTQHSKLVIKQIKHIGPAAQKCYFDPVKS